MTALDSRRPASLVLLGVCLTSALLASRSPADEATLTIPPAAADDARYQRVKRLLPAHVGCAVLVVGEDEHGEEVVFKQGFGARTMAIPSGEGIDSIRVTPQTNFRVATLTKAFTAAAVLKLADEGRLSLDDPLTKWLPGMPGYADNITLRHVLGHQSGLVSYWTLMNNNAPPYLNDLALLRTVAKAPQPDFPAGATCRYDNTGYVLLGLVVQQAGGAPFHEYLRREVLEPLGMERSAVLVEGLNEVPERAYGHKAGAMTGRERTTLDAKKRQLVQRRQLRDRIAAQGGNGAAIDASIRSLEQQIAVLTKRDNEATELRGLVDGAWHEEDQGPFSELGGDGALYTSIDDLHRLVTALAENRAPLSESSLELWTHSQTTPPPSSTDGQQQRRYAFGWILDERLGEPRLSHRGSTRGFRQTFQWLPESGRAVAVLMNSVPPGAEGDNTRSDARIERLGEQLLQVVLDPTDDASGLELLAEPIDLRD